jgi:hypothetical protein
MTNSHERGAEPASDYFYRRELSLPQLLPAIGVAVGVGAAAFYVARILLQRTPLVPVRDIPTVGPPPTITRRPVRALRGTVAG